jgi:hypothetical protein
MANPTTYTQATADEIVERLSKGEPLAEICRDAHMPAVRTVSKWRKAHPEFDASFLEARDAGFDEIAADCLRIANSPLTGEVTTTKEWGTETKKADMLDHRKLQIETRLKLLAKWDPRRYGERVHTEHSGELTVVSLSGRMRNRAPLA